MIYADYNFYRDNFRGKLIPEADFEHNALLASQYINTVTFGRIGTNVTDSVKNACCDLAEIYYSGKISPKAATGIASEKVGDYSVTYGSAENISTQKKRLKAAAALWLADSGLLYRGCG